MLSFSRHDQAGRAGRRRENSVARSRIDLPLRSVRSLPSLMEKGTWEGSAMDGRSKELSLILPAYNEAAGIREAIAEADEALARLADDYEILVVDDGSHDDTAAVVREEAARRPRVRLLLHETNRGYGAALRTGFEAARFDHVAFTDAD